MCLDCAFNRVMCGAATKSGVFVIHFIILFGKIQQIFEFPRFCLFIQQSQEILGFFI